MITIISIVSFLIILYWLINRIEKIAKERGIKKEVQKIIDGKKELGKFNSRLIRRSGYVFSIAMFIFGIVLFPILIHMNIVQKPSSLNSYLFLIEIWFLLCLWGGYYFRNSIERKFKENYKEVKRKVEEAENYKE